MHAVFHTRNLAAHLFWARGIAIEAVMDAHHPDDARFDVHAQGRADRRRLLRAFNVSLGFVLLMVLAYAAQGRFDWRPLAIAPQTAQGLIGIPTAPLLHGSVEHLASNAIALLMLGTLAGSVYPPCGRCRCCGRARAWARGGWAMPAPATWAPVDWATG